ncbi:hypothetical protein NDU88_009887 [Pleurodeles waltl]|uniref:Uncharacterized protein n=1 Tax=Pleurodeles waltl TaxID=8319 RepID=A0AAV7RZK5_PLEWA|nr:hypothetical protein NDU88_009887 [Pleurodeles waltl]
MTGIGHCRVPEPTRVFALRISAIYIPRDAVLLFPGTRPWVGSPMDQRKTRRRPTDQLMVTSSRGSGHRPL